MGLCACLPNSQTFMSNYPDYNDYQSSGDVWDLIGGSLNDAYGRGSENGAEDSCAARVSHALNNSGAEIPSSPAHQTNRNQGGSDGRYIISASNMNRYLRDTYGAPAMSLNGNGGAEALRASFIVSRSGGAAIVSSSGHTAVISASHMDNYVWTGDVWFLPTSGGCSC
ncbi:T6SS effector amidase Tae4 family protein [Kangiella sp. TOML190]|uniref:T6SS effector amidase Tae4 family protein n=1 Tax=Kangiella sp. TOML190 TaxID=2931351 RepID=UPI0035E32542